jgi:hypothetical protein
MREAKPMSGRRGHSTGDPSTRRLAGRAALGRLAILALTALGGSAALGAPVAHAQGATIYVAPGGTDSGTCGATTATACATISQAVTNAVSGDTISVASGNYNDAITIPGGMTLTIIGGNPEVSAMTVIHLKAPAKGTASVLSVGVGATVFVRGITFTGGTGTTIFANVYGGDVFNEGNLTLVDTTTENGSAIAGDNHAGYGGGIYSGIVRTTLAEKPSAAVAPAQLLVQWSFVGASSGPGGGNTAGGGEFATGGGIFNDFNSTMSVVCSLVAGNSASSTGAGLNEAEGGGIANWSNDTTTVIQPFTTAYTTTGNTIFNTELTGNTVSGAVDSFGGAVFLAFNASLALTDDTLDNNAATGGAAVGGAISSDGSGLTMSNSTVALNTATAGPGFVARGGGIELAASAVLHNVTIADNKATSASGLASGGGIAIASSATLANTLLARNSTVNAGVAAAADCDVAVGTDAGGNIDDDGTCVFGAGPGSVSNSKTIGLGQLGNNGGDQPTMSLAYPTSSAIGIGVAAVCEVLVGPDGVTLDTDERGLPRHAVTRGGCDSGAYDTGGSITLPNTVTAALLLAGGGRLGFAASTSASFNIGYITLQIGASTLVVRQPVVVSCPNQCLGTSAVPLPGPVTETLTGTVSSARGIFTQGQTVVVTLTIYRPVTPNPFGPPSLGNITVSSVSVSVNGTTVATATAPFLNARTVTYAALNQVIP